MQKSDYSQSRNTNPAEQQFREALSLVGISLKKNAQWFINFSNLNLDALSTEGKVQLWHNLLALMVLASRPCDMKAGASLTKSESSSWRYLEAWPTDHNLEKSSLVEERAYQGWWQWVVELQMQIGERIEGVLAHQNTPLQLTDVTLHLGPHGLIPVFPLDMFVDQSSGSDYLIRGADGPILIRLALVFPNYGNKIHRCPACGSIFLAIRKDQTFCTSTCRSRVGMKRWRAKHGSSVRGKTRSGKNIHLRKSIHHSSPKGKPHGTKGR